VIEYSLNKNGGKQMPYAFIFDCDGVLVESELISCTAGMLAINELGISTDLAEIQTMIGKSYAGLLAYFQHREGQVDLGFTLEELVEAEDRHYFQLADGLQAMPGIISLLDQLQKAETPLAVASSGGRRKIEFSLKKTDLLHYFPLICSATEVERGKPAPDLFLYTAAKLGRKPDECIVVEDSLYGVAAGKSAGMLTVGYSASFSAAELTTAGADIVIADYTDFMPALARQGIGLQ
jgi:HAD superfamily hydrolase (TIGR01509 family)